MKTTLAAVLSELHQPLEIMELSLPDPRPGEVLVKVVASGICHTQLLEIKGENATGPHNPNLMGHEGSGIVVATGAGVTKVKEGDHVVLSWIKGSGVNTCPPPLTHNGKKINRGPVTTFSQYSVVSENRVTPIPREMPLKPAALIGCAIATGMGMIFNNAKVKAGNSVAIIGCGGIGVNTVHAASIAQAGMIIAVDRLDEKLQAAKMFGATHTINASTNDPSREINRLTGSKGLDFAIDTVGRKETMELIYDNVSKTSGKAILCGVPNPPGQKIEIDPFPLYYGRRLVGTSGGETNPDMDFVKYCQMYRQGVLKLDAMISHVFGLAEINKGIELMKAGHGIRVLIDMEPA